MQQSNRLHSGYCHHAMRKWLEVNTTVSRNSLVYPMFVCEGKNDKEEISGMPGQYRVSPSHVVEFLKPIIDNGLTSVLLFGVVTTLPKDDIGSAADSAGNPVIQTIPLLRQAYPDLLISCDVCLCAYTNHGHCGILTEQGKIDNARSIQRLAEVATAYAKAGCHIVAPSDMMDGRVAAIKTSLAACQLDGLVAVMSYSAKFASKLYGPFRSATGCSLAHSDRSAYQLPPGSSSLAIRAVARDVEEGADMVIVKPGLPYLDICREVKHAHPTVPLCAYQVSGEYAMLWHGAKGGAFELRDGVMETMTCFRRAGCDVIITYFTPEILKWLQDSQ